MSFEKIPLSKLFKKSHKCYLDYPVSFIRYIRIINSNTKHLNLKNSTNLYLKYSKYLELFNDIVNTKKRIKQFTVLLKLGFYDKSTNIQYWLDRGWDKDMSNLYLRNRQNTMSLDSIMSRHSCSLDEAKRISKNITNKQTKTLQTSENYISWKYNSGNSSRWTFYLDKVNPNTDNFYTESEAKEKIRIKQSKGLTNFWKDVKSGKKYYTASTSLQYFLNKGLNNIEAKRALYERQCTFSLDICIEKYGEKKGLERFKKRQEKWQKALNDKSDEEKLDIQIKKFTNQNIKFYSNSSAKFFDELIEELSDNKIIFSKIYYKSNEYFIISNNRLFFYDFCIPELNLIIEYHGSHVHPNKNRLTESEWNKWRNPFTKESANICYVKDFHKKELAINNGFKYFEIWDTDHKYKALDKLKKVIFYELNKR